MEHRNNAQMEETEQLTNPEGAEQAPQEGAGESKGSFESASERLLSFSEHASVEEKIILEQIAGTKRDPRITKIGKRIPYWKASC